MPGSHLATKSVVDSKTGFMMEVVPKALCDLASACLIEAQELGDGWRNVQGSLTIPGGSAGNTPGGSDVLDAHVEAINAGATAIGRLVSVLEQDMDDLYLCAFDFSTTDEAEAGRYKSSTSAPPGRVPTPSPSPGPPPTPPS